MALKKSVLSFAETTQKRKAMKDAETGGSSLDQARRMAEKSIGQSDQTLAPGSPGEKPEPVNSEARPPETASAKSNDNQTPGSDRKPTARSPSVRPQKKEQRIMCQLAAAAPAPGESPEFDRMVEAASINKAMAVLLKRALMDFLPGRQGQGWPDFEGTYKKSTTTYRTSRMLSDWQINAVRAEFDPLDMETTYALMRKMCEAAIAYYIFPKAQ